jgi:hypothetical protein
MHYQARRRGFSRVELLIAVGLLAVVGASVFLVTRPSLAQNDRSPEHLAAPLVAALSAWQGDHPNECPTLGLLETEGYLERGTQREDAWGASFRVGCASSELVLLSPGPDAQLGTKDDLRIPIR